MTDTINNQHSDSTATLTIASIVQKAPLIRLDTNNLIFVGLPRWTGGDVFPPSSHVRVLATLKRISATLCKERTVGEVVEVDGGHIITSQVFLLREDGVINAHLVVDGVDKLLHDGRVRCLPPEFFENLFSYETFSIGVEVSRFNGRGLVKECQFLQVVRWNEGAYPDPCTFDKYTDKWHGIRRE